MTIKETSGIAPCDHCGIDRWMVLNFEERKIWCLNCGATRKFVISKIIHIDGSDVKYGNESI